MCLVRLEALICVFDSVFTAEGTLEGCGKWNVGGSLGELGGGTVK